MLTIRPNWRSTMPSITRCTSSIGDHHVADHARQQRLAVERAEVARTAGRRCC